MLAIAGCGGSSNPAVADAGNKDGTGATPGLDGPPAVAVHVAPATVNFGTIDIGASSPASVVNVTSATAVVVSPTVTGAGFLIDSTTCGTAATSCTISVKFSPASVGAASGILTVAPGLTVSLSGTGSPPGTFTLTPSVIPTTVLVNASLPVSVTVTATTALTDLSCLPSGADLTAAPATTTCTGTIAANTPCVYAYTFKSATPGDKSDSIVCSSGGVVKTVPVAPTVVNGPSLAITPNPGSFSASVGSTGAAITFNLANIGGSVTGALTTAPLGGANAADFAITDNKCVVPLAPLTTCAIQVVFKPTAVGARTATLTVTDATAGSTPATATLNGTAIAGTALAITGAANLGSVTIGQAGTASTYTITNSGGTATGALLVAAGPQFTIGSDLCSGLSLAAAKTCTFTITFSPTSAGVQSAVLSASSGGTTLATLQIQGTGVPATVPAALTMTPPTLDFGTIGVGTVSGTKTFTVTNTGATASGVLSVVKNDSTSSVGGASQFSYTTTCQAALDPAASCQIVVTFSPTIAGSASATITATDGTVSSPARTVVGIALTRPGIQIICATDTTSTSKWDFGNAVVGKASAPVVCTVKNDAGSSQATGALTLTAATAGEYAVATNNCTAALLPTGLAPGLSCTAGLTFSPTAKGVRNGTFTVSGTNGGAANVSLTGTGLGIVEIVEFAAGACAGHAIDFTGCTPEVQPYDFGQTTVGTLSDSTLTLAVYVRASVGNLSVTTAFGSPEEFTITSNGCSTYASTAPAAPFSLTQPLCLIYVQHKPVSRTVATGTVTVAGASSDTDSATMKGTGAGPLTISPSPATFSNVATGTASATLTLTVKNKGTVDINGASFTLTGANANQFSVVVDNLTGANLVANTGSRTIGVRFIPTAVGGAAATVTVTGTRADNAAVETATDSLIGNGATGASMTVTISNSGAFADTYAGATSAPLTVTVANATGSLPTGMVSFLLDGDDFSLTPPTTTPPTLQGTCAGATTNPVNGGATCTEFVWFKPSAASALPGRSGILNVTASPGATVDLPLAGNALPQLSIAPAGPATAPVDLGSVVIDTSTTPSATFTVTNHAESAIPAGSLAVALADSPNTPNRTSLFVIDTSATNGCSSVVIAGGTCTFKVTASAVSAHAVTPVDLGVFFAEVQASTGTGGVQMAKADIKATVVPRAALSFTPATDSVGTRDIGAVQRGAASFSTPILYTLVNTGGVNSGPITVNLYAVGAAGTTNPLTKPSDWGLASGTTCTTLTETGLTPGATCDILVAFHPTVDNPAPTALSLVDLSVKNTAGIAGTGELRRTIQGTGVAAGPYLVDSVTKLAPSYMGAPTGTVFTRTIEFHAGSAAVTPSAFSVTPVTGASIAAATTKGCGTTAVAANDFCNLTVTLDTAVGGWHVLTATVTSTGADANMNLLAKVPGVANLLASSDTLAFGLLPVGVASAQQTITITNIGEAKSAALVVTPNSTALIKTSGTCTAAGTTLAYLGTCSLNVWVVPAAAPGSNPDPSQVVVSAAGATSSTISVSWTGAGPAAISTADLATDFGKQAVLSTTDNSKTFTFTNASGALPTGPLSISVLNGTTVVRDFVIDSSSTCLAKASGLGDSESCTVTIQFTPRSLTTPAKAGTLTVSATPGGSATVSLTGTAIAALSVSATGVVTATDGTKSLDMGSVKSGTVGDEITVTFTNEIGAPKTGLLSMALSGANVGDILVTSDGCTGTQIATTTGPVAGFCQVKLKFAPKSIATGKTATITVSGSPGNSAALVLNGIGSAT
jgi:hypothetical protein